MMGLLVLLTSLAFGQARADEPQVWSSVQGDFELSDDWRAGAELGFRTAKGDRDELLTDLSVQARHLSFLHVAGIYRLAFDKWEDVRHKHRFAIDLTFRAKSEGIKFRLRHRQTLRLPGPDVKLKHVLRWRAKLAFPNESPLEPYLSAEPFMVANPEAPIRPDKLRLTAGTGFELGESEWSVYYRFEQPLADDNDPRLHIVGVSLGFGTKLYDD